MGALIGFVVFKEEVTVQKVLGIATICGGLATIKFA